MNKKISNVLMAAAACILIFSVWKIAVTLIQQWHEKEVFDRLEEQVLNEQETALEQKTSFTNGETGKQAAGAQQEVVGDTKNTGNNDSTGNIDNTDKIQERVIMETDPETGMLKPYKKLYEQNKDFFGWIKIPDTKINYPVMYTPDDMEYYLKRSFDGSDAKGGTPFLDTECSEDGHICIVYGHHMKNQTMFGSLPKYEKKEYWAEHPEIYFDTLYEQETYEIVAAFYSRIYSPDEEGFRYYAYKDLSDEQVFHEFKEGIEKEALYDTGISWEYGDTVLLLSTCSYHTEEGRFVVVAVKKPGND